MSLAHPLAGLMQQFQKLPGVGPKSAQRLAFFILSLPAKEVAEFAKVMVETRQTIRYCERCYNISIEPLCHICQDPLREKDTLCVVAEPRDILALERTREYKGRYHVLGGLISPLDGIHPEVLRINELVQRLKHESVRELILAINPTIEGDATSLYLTQLLKNDAPKISKLAYGLPVGADMDYADELTLQKALRGRTLC